MSHLSFLHTYASPEKHFDPVKEGEAAVNSDSWVDRAEYARQSYVAPEHLSRLLNDDITHVVRHAAMNPKIDPERLLELANHPTPTVRESAINNPNVTEKHLDLAIQDPDSSVRWNVAAHRKATPNQLQRALADDSRDVTLAAIYNKNTPTHMILPYKNSADSVISHAAGHEIWRRKESLLP